MWTDPNDIDLEDIESRLYGQVYHSSANDELSAASEQYRVNSKSTQEFSSMRRYFNTSDFNQFTATNSQHRQLNNVQNNSESRAQNPTVENQNISNYRPLFNHIQVPQLFINSGVNNIVVIPASSPQIFTPVTTCTLPQSKWHYKREQRRARQLEKRYAKRRNRRSKKYKNTTEHTFEENCTDLISKAQDNNIEIQTIDEIVVSSQSEHSDCEELTSETSLVVISSDEEGEKNNKLQIPVVEPENETNSSNVNKNDCTSELKTKELETSEVEQNINQNTKSSVKQNLLLEKDITNIKIKVEDNTANRKVQLIYKNGAQSEKEESDDIIFIEPKPKLTEVVVIDCDSDSNTVVNLGSKCIADADADACGNKQTLASSSHSSPTNSTVDGTPRKSCNKKSKTTISREQPELVASESTVSNDFLDNVELTQNKFNFSLHGTDFTCSRDLVKSNVITNLDAYETESSCSTSDIGTPVKNPIFNEVEFEAPPKEIFADSTLENFRSYITPKRKLIEDERVEEECEKIEKGRSKRSSKKAKQKTSKKIVKHTSDSSSESDYDNTSPVKSKKLTKKKKLPDLSPIQSDEESSVLHARKKKKKNERSAGNPDLDSTFEMEQQPTKTKKKKQSKQSKNNSGTVLESELSTKKANKSENNKKTPKGNNSLQEIGTPDTEKSKKRKSSRGNDTEATPTKKSKQKNPKQSNEHPVDVIHDINDEEVEVIDCTPNTASVIVIDDSDSSIVHESDTETRANFQLANVSSASVAQSPEILSPDGGNHKNFSHYWTEDMKKFYKESWGQENFNVNDVLETMSDDPNLWKILDRDRVHIALFKNNGPRCNKCREIGHRRNQCPDKSIKCKLCGVQGHLDYHCPNKICTTCGRRSRYFTTKCSRCSSLKYSLCQICQVRGHLKYNCPDLWRRYHLTVKEGPPVQQGGSELKLPKDLWCSGCSKQGHIEFNCRHFNGAYRPVNPVIHEYESIYRTERSSANMQNQDSEHHAVSQQEDHIQESVHENPAPETSQAIVETPKKSGRPAVSENTPRQLQNPPQENFEDRRELITDKPDFSPYSQQQNFRFYPNPFNIQVNRGYIQQVPLLQIPNVAHIEMNSQMLNVRPNLSNCLNLNHSLLVSPTSNSNNYIQVFSNAQEINRFSNQGNAMSSYVQNPGSYNFDFSAGASEPNYSFVDRATQIDTEAVAPEAFYHTSNANNDSANERMIAPLSQDDCHESVRITSRMGSRLHNDYGKELINALVFEYNVSISTEINKNQFFCVINGPRKSVSVVKSMILDFLKIASFISLPMEWPSSLPPHQNEAQHTLRVAFGAVCISKRNVGRHYAYLKELEKEVPNDHAARTLNQIKLENGYKFLNAFLFKHLGLLRTKQHVSALQNLLHKKLPQRKFPRQQYELINASYSLVFQAKTKLRLNYMPEINTCCQLQKISAVYKQSIKLHNRQVFWRELNQIHDLYKQILRNKCHPRSVQSFFKCVERLKKM